MNDSILLIFTKYPSLGKCKTRLAKSIGDKKALEVYQHLLDKTARIASELAVDTAVFFNEKIDPHHRWKFSYYHKLQAEGNLGNKMKNAFEWAFEMKYNKVCIIGSDLWDIEASELETAFEALLKYNICIGPAKDGGYYLIGSNSYRPELVDLNEWSTPDVYKKTIEKAGSNSVFVLKEKNDIDTIEDLKDIPFFEHYLC